MRCWQICMAAWMFLPGGGYRTIGRQRQKRNHWHPFFSDFR